MVALAQAEAFKKRIPLTYAILIVNIVSICCVYSSVAPSWLTFYAPGAFLALITVRLIKWKQLQSVAFTEETARRTIRFTMKNGTFLGLLLLSWACALYPYGDTPAAGQLDVRAHLILFVGLSVIPTMFLLMHVRAAALAVAVVAVPPFCAYLLSFGTPVEIAVALNLLVVSAAMLYVAMGFSFDFEDLIISKQELSRLSDQNEKLAFSDALTTLPNRRKWFTHLARIAESQAGFAVVVLDLDRFKQINDLHGHLVGDQVLVDVGTTLQRHVPADACLARMGGDEFAIILPGAWEPDKVMALCRDLIAVCKNAVSPELHAIKVGVTMGVSICAPGAYSPAQNHYMLADYALSHTKQNGRGDALLFTPEHERSLRRDAAIEHALRTSDMASEIHLEFQPIVRAGDGEVVAYEALTRWRSSTLGAVSPSELFPIAERSSLIHDLTHCILRKALQAAEAWPETIGLKVNLSARDLVSPVQLLRLIATVAESSVSPRRIMFEITETALVPDLTAIQPTLTALRASGAAVAIDDFGTGFSSLSYIHQMAPETIKIDGSFVRRLGDDPVAASIIRTIVELCRSIGARSVAECVETIEQVELLRDLGCDELQGYYFGKPQAAASLIHTAALPMQVSA